MTSRLFTGLRHLAVGTLMAAVALVSRTSWAAPKITVTKTLNSVTATTVSITVKGTGFTKKKQDVVVEVDQGGAFSGNLPRTYNAKTDNNGAFSLTQTVNHSSSCLIGVFATDVKSDKVSNGVDLPIEPPCATPHIKISSHSFGSNALIPEGVSFTPNPGDDSSSISVEYTDTTDGFSEGTGDFVSRTNGTFGPSGHYHIDSNRRCRHVWSIFAIDDDTDTFSNTVRVLSCTLTSKAVDCTTVTGQGCP